MVDFQNGRLIIREFESVASAHLAASRLASAAVTDAGGSSGPDFRLLEVAPTAGGAWVCAFVNSTTAVSAGVDRFAKDNQFEIVTIDQSVINAFLSLGPQVDKTTRAIGIIENESIASVFRSAQAYVHSGIALLEIRVKRSGPRGAYAFFKLNLEKTELPNQLAMQEVPLVGDYRRFF